MKLAIFDDYRLGVVAPDEQTIVDVSAALPWPHDPEPFGAGWWVRLCRDFSQLRGRLEDAATKGQAKRLESVTLRAPVLNPTKIVAAAVNYAAHHDEMVAVQQRVGSQSEGWQMQFDVFLKSPSSIVGPGEPVVLPSSPEAKDKEVHHESELGLIIGRAASHIREEDAYQHILGYTIGLDMTVRGNGDRSRRKSYDTFTPIGPWIVTADEIPDPHDLEIKLAVGGKMRQDVHTSTMTKKIPELLAYASAIMRLEPGDVVITGAPPGVGQVVAGDVMESSITRIGRMTTPVRG